MDYTVLLISICPVNEVKVEKLPIIARYTCNSISKLLQGGKNMVTFCSTVQKSHWLFYVGSLDC